MHKQHFLERVIRRFIPPPILYVCEAEGSGWFAEIGRVAVIFVNIAIKGPPGVSVMQSVFLVSCRRLGSGATPAYDPMTHTTITTLPTRARASANARGRERDREETVTTLGRADSYVKVRV